MKITSYSLVAAVLVLALAGVLFIAGCTSSAPATPVTTTSPPAPVPTAIPAVTTAVPVMTTMEAMPTPQVTTSAPAMAGNEVAIKNLEFDPQTITVKAGTTVTWTNMDPVPHTVTSKTPSPVSFNSGTLEQGQSFSNTFIQPGTYPYFCTIHTFMTGSVIVTP